MLYIYIYLYTYTYICIYSNFFHFSKPQLNLLWLILALNIWVSSFKLNLGKTLEIFRCMWLFHVLSLALFLTPLELNNNLGVQTNDQFLQSSPHSSVLFAMNGPGSSGIKMKPAVGEQDKSQGLLICDPIGSFRNWGFLDVTSLLGQIMIIAFCTGISWRLSSYLYHRLSLLLNIFLSLSLVHYMKF